MMQEELNKLCDAKKEICKYCTGNSCEDCAVTKIVAKANKEADEQDREMSKLDLINAVIHSAALFVCFLGVYIIALISQWGGQPRWTRELLFFITMLGVVSTALLLSINIVNLIKVACKNRLKKKKYDK